MRKHKKGKVTRRKLEKKRAKEKGRIVTDFNHRMVRNMATFLSNNIMANTQKKIMKKKSSGIWSTKGIMSTFSF